jgi:hypothetical protein
MSMSDVPKQRRAGVSLLELQVAFVVFGIALAGLAPLTVMQLRQLHMLEERLNDTTTYYLTPATDPWARKLGAAAAINSTAPEAIEPPGAVSSANEVQILSLEKPFAGEEVTVHVSVTAVPQ